MANAGEAAEQNIRHPAIGSAWVRGGRLHTPVALHSITQHVDVCLSLDLAPVRDVAKLTLFDRAFEERLDHPVHFFWGDLHETVFLVSSEDRA